MRVLKEKVALLGRMAERTGHREGPRYRDEAQGYEHHTETIRAILIRKPGFDPGREAIEEQKRGSQK